MKSKILYGLCILAASLMCRALPVHAQQLDVPDNNEMKTYMSYKAITSTSSDQYKLQQQCVTDEQGFRVYDGRYCIALGTYYTDDIGVNVDVVLTNGTVIPCVTGDIKSDAHTDSTRRQIPSNGNVVEFIVDTSVMSQDVLHSGDISNISGFAGEISHLDIHSDSIVMSTYDSDVAVFVTY